LPAVAGMVVFVRKRFLTSVGKKLANAATSISNRVNPLSSLSRDHENTSSLVYEITSRACPTTTTHVGISKHPLQSYRRLYRPK